MTGTALTFDLAAEAEALRQEPTWQQSGHNAKTLIKHSDVRVVLIALRQGARMQEHKTDQCVTIHALEGNLRLHLPSSTIDLQKGSIIALDHTVVHDVEAHALCHPTNVAFRGTTLFLSNLGRWHVAAVEVGVEGAPLPPRR